MHQHTQTHSTRLVAVTTDSKRKLPLPIPGTTLIKIETDCTTGATTLDLNQTKTLQAVSTMASNTGTVYTDQTMAPLVTTHVIYQHPTTNLILSQAPAETACRSQATSPVACLTPPPEIMPAQEEEECQSLVDVQDAGNQTDIPIGSEDENTSHTVPDEIGECKPLKINDLPPDVESPIKRDFIAIVPEIVTPKIVEIVEEQMDKNEVEEMVQEEQQIEEPESLSCTEAKVSCKPDLSGLELLSNSIVEFENCRKSVELTGVQYEEERRVGVVEKKLENGEDVLKGIAHMTLKDEENDVGINKRVDESLGGLGLLCALAEQRFMEEEVEKQRNEERKKSASAEKDRKRQRSSEERRKEKRKRKERGESKSKRMKANDFEHNRHFDEDCISYKEKEKIRVNELDLDRERLSVLKRVTGERLSEKGKRDLSYDFGIECDKQNGDNSNSNDDKCGCKQERYRTYKNKKSEEEVKKFIASKSQTSYSRNEWPFMNAMELDMRLRLAELQRQYKEKQRELSKLTPRKSIDCNDCSKRGPGRPPKKCSEKSSTPPPLLDKMDEPPVRNKSPPELLKPPTLCAFGNSQESPKFFRSNSAHLPDGPQNTDHIESVCKRSYSSGPDLSDSTPEKISSSKKRKVGRPKKLMSSSGLHIATETIVAKKPRSKSSLVGYLLAAKNRMQLQTKTAPVCTKNGPPKYIEEPVKKSKSHKSKSPKDSESKEHRSSKIRPKLKAEPTLKMYTEDDDPNAEWDRPCTPIEKVEEMEIDEPEVKKDVEIEEEVEDEEHEEVEEPEEPEEEIEEELEEKVESAETVVECVVVPAAEVSTSLPQDTRCVLSKDHLEVDKLRVLTAMGGLFYAGRLSAVEAPDVYAITLDGERGNRPHIMSREEILRDAVSVICTFILLLYSISQRCIFVRDIKLVRLLVSNMLAVEFRL